MSLSDDFLRVQNRTLKNAFVAFPRSKASPHGLAFLVRLEWIYALGLAQSVSAHLVKCMTLVGVWCEVYLGIEQHRDDV